MELAAEQHETMRAPLDPCAAAPFVAVVLPQQLPRGEHANGIVEPCVHLDGPGVELTDRRIEPLEVVPDRDTVRARRAERVGEGAQFRVAGVGSKRAIVVGERERRASPFGMKLPLRSQHFDAIGRERLGPFEHVLGPAPVTRTYERNAEAGECLDVVAV